MGGTRSSWVRWLTSCAVGPRHVFLRHGNPFVSALEEGIFAGVVIARAWTWGLCAKRSEMTGYRNTPVKKTGGARRRTFRAVAS